MTSTRRLDRLPKAGVPEAVPRARAASHFRIPSSYVPALVAVIPTGVFVFWVRDSLASPWIFFGTIPFVYFTIVAVLYELWDHRPSKPSGHEVSVPVASGKRGAPNSDSGVLSAYFDLFADRHPAVYDADLLPAPKERIRALLGKAIEKETSQVRVDQLCVMRRALDDFGEIEDEDRVLVNLLNGLLTNSSKASLDATRGGRGIPHKSEQFLALTLKVKYRQINEGTFTQEDRERTRETIQRVLAGQFDL